MTTTLFARKTPKRMEEEMPVLLIALELENNPVYAGFGFKQPVKGFFARRYYDHDGSLCGGKITIGQDDLVFLNGIVDLVSVAASIDKRERCYLEEVIEIIKAGDTIDIWIE